MRFKRAGIGAKLLIVVLLVASITALLGVKTQLDEAERDRDLLSAQVQEQQEENTALADDIANSDDPEYLANIARIKLGLLEPDEIEFVDTSH